MCLPHTLPLYLYIHEDLMTKVRQLPSVASTYTLCKWIQLCHMRTLVGDLTDVVPFNRCLNPLLQLKHKLSEKKKKKTAGGKTICYNPRTARVLLHFTPISQISHSYISFLLTVESFILSSSVIFMTQSPLVTRTSDQTVKCWNYKYENVLLKKTDRKKKGLRKMAQSVNHFYAVCCWIIL